MHATQAAMASGGLSVFDAYDSNTGHLQTTCGSASAASCDGTLANFTYGWDVWGDLVYRADALAGTGGLTENFCYDSLNRVTYEGVGSSCNATGRIEVAYDALGDITSKSDICWTSGGCYTYGAGGAGPHAVTSISSTGCSSQNPGCLVNGIANPSFSYDANGNMTCTRANGTGSCGSGAARYATWTSFNMAASISQSGTPLYALS
jgi:hypothetical protein